jgi:hypothetical protein
LLRNSLGTSPNIFESTLSSIDDMARFIHGSASILKTYVNQSEALSESIGTITDSLIPDDVVSKISNTILTLTKVKNILTSSETNNIVESKKAVMKLPESITSINTNRNHSAPIFAKPGITYHNKNTFDLTGFDLGGYQFNLDDFLKYDTQTLPSASTYVNPTASRSIPCHTGVHNSMADLNYLGNQSFSLLETSGFILNSSITLPVVEKSELKNQQSNDEAEKK